jgi:hypothetical protein
MICSMLFAEKASSVGSACWLICGITKLLNYPGCTLLLMLENVRLEGMAM